MTTTIKLISAFVITVGLMFFGYLFSQINYARAADTNQNPATVATTSVNTVNTTASLVFATSTCASRTISTTASPIMIGFTDAQGFVPSGISGFVQAASTTVTYDASQYGCRALRVYSFTSGPITVQESK